MNVRAIALLSAVMFAAPPGAQQLPVLPELHSAVRARRADLAERRASLAAARAKILQDSSAFDSRCARVVQGSSDDKWCADNFPVLKQQALDHCSATTAFAAAYLAALDEAAAPLASEAALTRERLRGLGEQLRRYSESFETQRVASAKGIDAAIAKIYDLSLLELVSSLTAGSVDTKIQGIKDQLDIVRPSERVRALKDEDVRAAIAELQAQLKGKTAAQARQILIDHLNEQLRIMDAYKAAMTGAADALYRYLDATPPAAEEQSAQDLYALVTAGIEAIGRAGRNSFNRAGKLMGAAAWAPNAIDGIVMAADATLSVENYENLRQLQELAEADLNVTMARNRRATDAQRELDALRPELRAVAAFVCN